MKLVDILARELIQWPSNIDCLWISNGNTIYGKNGLHEYIMNGGWPIPEDHGTAIVYRDHWLSALGESAPSGSYGGGLDAISALPNVSAEDRQAAVDARKAESAPAWAGIGLPPVGTVCLMLQHKCAPVEVQIRYQEANICVWVETSIAREFCTADAHKLEFRPIRTPEQIIADREREERIKAAQVWLEGIAQAYGADTADKCEDILMEFENRKQEAK